MAQNEEIIDQEEDYLDDDDTMRDRYLTFRLGEEEYAVEIQYVTEIIGMQKVTQVPNVKDYIKGIINLRGIIYPVVEVRKRFMMDIVDYDERTCIIVVKVNNTGIGLIVDEVSEVMEIHAENISPAPQTYKGSQSRFIQGLGKAGDKVKIVLDINKLLYDELKAKETDID